MTALARLAAAVEPRARYNLGITLFNLTDYQGAIRELEALARLAADSCPEHAIVVEDD